jgi:hypothetical protein
MDGSIARALACALTLAGIGCGGASAGGVASASTTTADGALFPSMLGTVRLESLPATLRSGQPVLEIVVRVDGGEVARCPEGALHRCLEPGDLLPGSHRIEIVLVSRLGTDPDVIEMPLSIAAGELVVLDVSRGSVRREGGAPAASNDCEGLLAQLTAASSACTSEELESAIRLAESAESRCREAPGDVRRAQTSIAQIVLTFTGTSADACFSADELRLLPPAYAGGYFHAEGELTSLSTFSWMRATVQLRDLQNRALPDVLRALRDALVLARPRFEIAHAIARAYIEYPRIGELVSLARAQPFSLDPDQPGGRIVYTLVNAHFVASRRTTPEARAGLAELSAWLGERVANDSGVHCDQWPMADALSAFFAGTTSSRAPSGAPTSGCSSEPHGARPCSGATSVGETPPRTCRSPSALPP